MSSSGRGTPALVIDPEQLKFTGPFNNTVTVQLKLTNVSSERRVCFKLKTNVPHQYCVHPSVAIVEPLEHVLVDVILQPCSSMSRPDVDCSHKFMVQSIFAPPGHITSLDRLWLQAKQDDIVNTKLPCVFEQPISRITSEPLCNGSSSDAVTRHRDDVDNVTSSVVVTSAEKSNKSLSLLLLLLVAAIAIVYKLLQ